MVAYSFNKQFSKPILSGVKSQTIRADRKRHARAGEALQLYTGMRTRHCRLIGLATCAQTAPIRIQLHIHPMVEIGDQQFTPLNGIDDFARSDGFEDWRAMRLFWEENHPDVPIFSGLLIRWTNFIPSSAIDAWANR
jgi:hypothetical protein